MHCGKSPQIQDGGQQEADEGNGGKGGSFIQKKAFQAACVFPGAPPGTVSAVWRLLRSPLAGLESPASLRAARRARHSLFRTVWRRSGLTFPHGGGPGGGGEDRAASVSG